MIRMIVIASVFARLLVCINLNENQSKKLISIGSSQLDSPDSKMAMATATSPAILDCPSTNLIRVKYKCPGPSNSWTDCSKYQCCPGYNLINGECISTHINPCSLNLCEQRCAFVLQKIVCTCWDGYKFIADSEKRNNQSMCIDIDECTEGIHDCQQICENTRGSYVCTCEDGFTLSDDNKTCMQTTDATDGDGGKCVVNCHTVQKMQKKITKLQGRLSALEITISLLINNGTQYSFRGESTDPPGSSGSSTTPRPPGSLGGATSHDLHHTSTAYSGEMTKHNSHSILDSYIQTNVGYCKCQRGPIGPQGPSGTPGRKGATGDRGPRGAKGATGNVDFLFLILADIRHDIILLQERIFPGEILPKFDFEAVLKKQRSIAETKMHENHQREDIKNSQALETVQISDYTHGERFAESSGAEWDHYDE